MSVQPEPTVPDALKRAATAPDGLALFLRDCTRYATREEFWQAVQQSIRERLGLERFSLWFRQTELVTADERRLVVGVPNVIVQQFLTLRYAEAVAAAVEDLVGRRLEVGFEVAPRLFRQMRARQDAGLADAEADKGHPTSLGLVRSEPAPQREWGFDHLIATRTNRLSYEAARELAGQENPRFRLLYVSGDYGVGKTALLRAVFAVAAGPERGLDPVFMTAEDWSNQFYHAIQRSTTHLFRSRCRSCNMLLLDDIQFVEGKEAGQRELLHTIKHILGKGGRVALSSVRHAEELKEVDPALLAVLKSAFPAALRPPAPDERAEIAMQLAARHGLQAAEEVYGLIAERHGHSFAAMESAVCHLALYAAVHGCGRVELADARGAFAAARPASAAPVDLRGVREAVLEAFPVTAEQLTGRSRSRTVCAARHAAIYLARRFTDASLTEIGRAFGGISHSTAKHAVDKVAAALGSDPRLALLISRFDRSSGAA